MQIYKDSPMVVEGGFETQSGVFSSDGIDPGSELLAKAIIEDLSGTGADLG